MRKFLIIFLSFLIFAPAVCTYSLLLNQKRMIKKSVKKQIIAGIKKEELVFLKFSTAEADTLLNWEHSKEFEYKGEMYDVVEKQVRNDSVFYWCWWDYKETNLNKKLTAAVADLFGNGKETKKTNNKLVDFFKTIYHTKHNIWKVVSEQKTLFHNDYALTYNSLISPPPVPPPEC